ncbi:hypothetical protein [Rubellicoccus peritrichatus]|uniref:Uncharacterized protein n=1 Tax=Rubellicoccus peritrichatus TaxID=3080537 RepID=A0AAQ3LBX4_9BACT|nr:hypothetical protein [Puniceicoccus sp. CR14]WOO42462.1 hypothetical protein RZN69_05125 [Puniceicoccus sp. CR14]
MPSFEHTDSQAESNNEPIYQPGKNENAVNEANNESDSETASTPLPVSKPQVTHSGDIEASAIIAEKEQKEKERKEAEAKAAAEAKAKAEAEAEAQSTDGDGDPIIPKAERNPGRAPTFIDSHLPDPGPSILQNVKKSPAKASKPKRSGLKGRNRNSAPAPTGTKSGVLEFGEVSASEASESLTGKRVKDGALIPPPEKKDFGDKALDKPNSDKPKRSPKPGTSGDSQNKGKENQPKNKDGQPREKRPRQDRGPKSGEKREPGQRQKQGDRKPRNNNNRRNDKSRQQKPAPQPKVEEPKTLLGKVKKFFGDLFGGDEPRKMTAPPAQPKTGQKKQGGNNRKRPPNNQRKDGEGRPQGKRPNNRRGGRGRGGRGRGGQGKAQGQGQQQGQNRNNNNQKRPRREGDAN